MAQATKKQTTGAPRVSVTFPEDHYDAISRMAEQRKVSRAWVVRDAVERYLAAETPLFDEARRAGS